MESVGDTSGQLWFGAAEPQKCYYLAVGNNAGEFCVFGIVFEEKDTMVYVCLLYTSHQIVLYC